MVATLEDRIWGDLMEDSNTDFLDTFSEDFPIYRRIEVRHDNGGGGAGLWGARSRAPPDEAFCDARARQTGSVMTLKLFML